MAEPILLELTRNEYGALNLNTHFSVEHRRQVKALLDEAIATSTGPSAAYIKGDSKEFECVNHDVYDVLLFRGKVRGLIIQERWFWKHKRKGHTSQLKDYFLIIRKNRKLRVEELDRRTCVKRAKNSNVLGALIKHYLGRAVVKCKPAVSQVHKAYKVLARNEDGTLVSVYDDSPYKLGVWRSQRAEEDHGGGFYCYPDAETALHQTRTGCTFAESVSAGKELVLCEVEISGRQVWYDSGKLATSRIRVMSVLEVVLLEAGVQDA